MRVSASVILETDTVELSCENTEDLKMEMCVFIINGRESNSKLSSSCQLSVTGSQINIWSGGQSSSVRITCFYTVIKGQVSVPSPHSDPVTVTVQGTFFMCICGKTDLFTATNFNYFFSKTNDYTHMYLFILSKQRPLLVKL